MRHRGAAEQELRQVPASGLLSVGVFGDLPARRAVQVQAVEVVGGAHQVAVDFRRDPRGQVRQHGQCQG
ncbi:MAG: hypothetical protein ACUVXH_12585, partial [Anaerolineae bacterium]